MARKTKEEAEKTFHQLLDAAATLFTQKGVANTTLNDIAKEANLTRGAIYWHFQGKDDIIRALFETYAVPKLRPLEERLCALSQDNPIDEFKQVFKSFIDLITQDLQAAQAFHIAILNVEVTVHESEIVQYLQSEEQRFMNALLHSFTAIGQIYPLKKNLTVEQAATGFLCLMHGILDRYLTPSHQFDLEVMCPTLIDVYLDGVLTSRSL